MDLNKLTMKSQAALEAAQQQAAARNHQTIEPEHLLFALLSDPEGVVYPLLHQLGVTPKRCATGRRGARPDAQGVRAGQAATCGSRRRPARCWSRPVAEAETLTDEYVSTEHLLLALLEVDSGASRILTEAGLTRDGVLAALAEVRGRQRVTDQNPEEKYQALERYGRDLTELAPAGQARPGDRPRRGDPPGDPGALPPHEEQPGPDRRARRRQDRDRRGPRAAHRRRRRPRVAQEQARDRARHRGDGRRLEVPRRVRGAASRRS